MVATTQSHDRDVQAAEAVIQNPLMREEVRRSAEQAKSADFSRNMSQYMFWGATTLLGAVALGLAGIGGVTAQAFAAMTLPLIGLPIIPVFLAISAVAFIGSVMFSRHATHIEKYNEVLTSDIDSQNQAHRMVQAFAKAQAQGRVQADDSAPMTSTAPSWSSRVGGQAQTAGSWQERVVAQAEREEAQNIAAVRG